MHYLIDGHNLIAQIDDIDLSDPDDEAQLILRLRRWISASLKRRVTVYFDGGLPGGEARDMSGTRLRVIFASSGSNADALLIRRIRRVQNPPEYTLVTNDREIVDVAARRKLPHLPSDHFAAQMAAEAEERERPAPEPQQAEAPVLSEAEVAEWLEMFGPEPEIPRPQRRPRRGARRAAGEKEAPQKKTSRQQPVRPADELKESGAGLTDAEVAAWLDEFGEAAPRPAAPEPDKKGKTRKEIRQRRRERRSPPRPADKMKESGAQLSQDEVETWLDIFNDPEEKEE